MDRMTGEVTMLTTLKEFGRVILALVFIPIACLISPIGMFKFFHRFSLTTEVKTDIPHLAIYSDVVLDILEECNLRQDLYTEDLAPWPAEGDSTDNITLHFRGSKAATAYTLMIGNTLRDRIVKRGITVARFPE